VVRKLICKPRARSPRLPSRRSDLADAAGDSRDTDPDGTAAGELRPFTAG
jgi:hypothetical protein